MTPTFTTLPSDRPTAPARRGALGAAAHRPRPRHPQVGAAAGRCRAATAAAGTLGPVGGRAARAVDGASRPSAATIARRRLAVAAVAVALAATAAGGVRAVISVLSGPGGVPASAAGAGTAPRPPHVVRAEPGDSLWSIAERFRGDVPIRRYLDALIDRNGGTRIVVGQVVRLP